MDRDHALKSRTPESPPDVGYGPELTDESDDLVLEPSHGWNTSMGPLGSPAPAIEPIAAGTVILGRYRILRRLGEGGMGQVWLVHHLRLQCERAVKLINAGYSLSKEARLRFAREARSMASLSHPHVAVVHDADVDGALAFIEMEYIRGTSLNHLLKSGVPMPLDWTSRVLLQLCDALEVAHAHRIVHRDLKPSNLILLDDRPTGKEFLKVLDFGIAKILEEEGEETDDSEPITSGFLGTPLYASPEQMVSDHLDGRSDLYSVGVLLYEFLTGYRPFSGKPLKVQQQTISTPPPTFLERNPTLPSMPAIERVVMRCLAKSPEDRYQTAGELAEAFLSAVIEERGPSEAPSGFGSTVPGGSSSRLPTASGGPSTSRGPVAADSGLLSSPSGTATLPLTDEDVEGGSTQGLHEALGAISAGPRTGTRFTRPGRRRKAPAPALAWGAVACVLVAGAAVFALSRRGDGRPPVPPIVPKTGGEDGENRQVTLVPTAPALPAGYVAEPGAATDAGRPEVLVREGRPAGPRFVLIEGGPFLRGAYDKDNPAFESTEKPGHIVRLSDFYLQETEVTFGEMEAYFDATGAKRPIAYEKARDELKAYYPNSDRWQDHPAVEVSRRLAEQYAEYAGGRLPTEAEWEFAARSRVYNRLKVWGDVDGIDQANVFTQGDSRIYTIPVRGGYEARRALGRYVGDRTEQGILDLMGNVREWCKDVWRPYPAAIENPDPCELPRGVASETYVIRGGSFLTPPEFARTTYRGGPREPDYSADDLGFRIVLECPPRVEYAQGATADQARPH